MFPQGQRKAPSQPIKLFKNRSQFVVMGENDVVILKTIKPPSMAEFDSLIAKARSQGKKAGFKQSDITAAIAKARGLK
jgi:hypothetical protein